MSGKELTTVSGNPAAIAPTVDWRTALETFLNTLNSPRTRRAYERAILDAMEVMGIDLVVDLMPPILAEYRALSWPKMYICSRNVSDYLILW